MRCPMTFMAQALAGANVQTARGRKRRMGVMPGRLAVAWSHLYAELSGFEFDAAEASSIEPVRRAAQEAHETVAELLARMVKLGHLSQEGARFHFERARPPSVHVELQAEAA